MNNFLFTFIILSIINVVFATIRSITTISGNKWVASFVSGGYFAFYNIMMLYTVADFPMWQKCIITFICNVIGVYLVKWGEEKARKDKLWKVEATVNTMEEAQEIIAFLKDAKIPCNYIDINRYVLINCYCATQKQSVAVKDVLNTYNAKYFVSESKTL